MLAESPPAPASPGPATPRSVSPWLDRCFARLPLGPWTASVLVALGAAGAFLGIELALGRLDGLLDGTARPDIARNVRIALVECLLLGYLVGAHRALRRWARQALDELEPHLDLSGAERASLRGAVGTARPAAARRAGWVGVAIALAAGPIVDRGVAHFLQAWYWGPETATHWLLVPVVGWLAGRLIFASGVESRRIAALAGRLRALDLFDLRPLATFTRQGLRSALLWLLMLSILSLLLTNRGFGPLVAGLGLLSVGVGLRALLGPVRLAHEQVVAAKEAELARVRAEIHRDRAALATLEAAAERAAVRLPGLLAYEQRIEAVREWPFDASTLARTLLYLGIPLGSWLGGALVERLVESLLE